MNESSNPTPSTEDPARELQRLRRAVYALRDDLAELRVGFNLMRQDLSAAYGLLRLLRDLQAERRDPT